MQSQGQKTAPNTTSKKMAQPGHQTALPALIPQQEPDDQQVEKNCMQCDRDALDVARCPLSGLWFCNDECRQTTRETQSKFFEQMIRNNATKQQTPPVDAPVRKSGRNTPKAIEIDDSPPKVAPVRQRAPPQAMDVDYEEEEEQQEEEEDDGEDEEDEEVGRLVVPPPVNRTLPLTKKKKKSTASDASKKKTTKTKKSGATHDNSKKKKRPQDTPAKKGKKKSRKAPVVAEKTK
jgi:hypothetical protein